MGNAQNDDPQIRASLDFKEPCTGVTNTNIAIATMKQPWEF